MAITLNYRPHRGQQLIHDARDARFRVVCTGRRFGKTLCLAGELLDRGALAPGDYGWIAPTYNVAERGKEAFRDIADVSSLLPNYLRRLFGRYSDSIMQENSCAPQ